MVFSIRSKTTTEEVMDKQGMKGIVREAFTNGSILLLLGGMLIGYSGTDKSMVNIQPFFDQLYLTLSLGVTFPFNVVIGIPLYYHLAQALA